MDIEQLPPRLRNAIGGIVPAPIGLVVAMLVRDAVFGSGNVTEAKQRIEEVLLDLEYAVRRARIELTTAMLEG